MGILKWTSRIQTYNCFFASFWRVIALTTTIPSLPWCYKCFRVLVHTSIPNFQILMQFEQFAQCTSCIAHIERFCKSLENPTRFAEEQGCLRSGNQSRLGRVLHTTCLAQLGAGIPQPVQQNHLCGWDLCLQTAAHRRLHLRQWTVAQLRTSVLPPPPH